MTGSLVAGASLAVVMLTMLGELRVSRANERRLLREGAIAPFDPAYSLMRWAYPGAFVAMAIEGAAGAQPPGLVMLAGVLTFAASKALKYWAIASLGYRWTYKVLVLPGVPLVTTGPYRRMRHPNYVAVVGELLGMALAVGAPIAGSIGGVFFGLLLTWRIRWEERAHRSAGGALAGGGAGGSGGSPRAR